MKFLQSILLTTLVFLIVVLVLNGPVCADPKNQKQFISQQGGSASSLAASYDFVPPTNDECATATVISSVAFVDSVDATQATPNGSDPVLYCGAGGGGNTVWYVFTPSSSMLVTAITFGSNYDTVIGLFVGDCGSLEQIGCNDDAQGVQSAVTWKAIEGVTYYIHVAEYGGGSGGGNLVFSLIPGNLEPPTFIHEFARAGNDPGEIAFSVGVAVDDNCNVFIADYSNLSIHKFGSDGTFITRWGGVPGSGDGEFYEPVGVDVDDNGNVYVVEETNARLQKFTNNGTYITQWGSPGSGNSQFYLPNEVAVDRNSWVYVADSGNDRVQKFNTTGGYVRQWGSSGTGDGQFDAPVSIAVGPNGNVYVADLYNNRIQKFTALGVFLTKWGSSGTGNGQFDQPHGLAVDKDGFVYVGDADNNRIQKFTGDGVYLMKWGTLGSESGQFDSPRSVHVDENGNIYVMDTLNFRVQVFAPSPEPLVWSVVDIGNDQGRQVRINFDRSQRDEICSTMPLHQYEVFRRIDPLPSSSAMAVAPKDVKMVSSPGILLEDWEFVGALPAHGESEYSIVVPTLADSTISHGMHLSVFFVRAATADPFVFFDSEEEAGYSLDNLAPGVPLGLTVAYNTGSGNELMWDPSPETDFQYYRVYRGDSETFTPGPENLVAQTASPEWTDPEYDGWDVHYKITALDHAGNESDATSTASTTGDDTPSAPDAFALYQNVPNPFNPATTIRFDLPKTSYVNLSVFNVKGELVSTIADRQMSEGRKEFIWKGVDGRGRSVSSGIYFYRIVAGEFVQTKKMVLLR